MTWDQVRHFHRQQQIIAGWRAVFGPALRVLTPSTRRLLLGIASLWVAYDLTTREARRVAKWDGYSADRWGLIASITVVLGFVLLCCLVARRFSSLPALLRKHPQLALHAIWWALIAWWWEARPEHPAVRTALGCCVSVMPFVLWRVGYMMMTAQRGKIAGTRWVDHLFYIFPVWRGSETPYGKGWDYLSANEAKDEESLARSQLAGVKIILLGFACGFLRNLMDACVFGRTNSISAYIGEHHLGFFRPNDVFGAAASQPRWSCWLAIYLDLIYLVLDRAAYGHIVIGYLRLFGFNVFRNTYKPLLAESIVEFWNRYYYYFKELLVNFFFYPTFTRWFKKSPRLRMYAAVFMAACVGNVYYHWMDGKRALMSADFATMGQMLTCRVFYCALLATGICISMSREPARVRNRNTQSIVRRVLAIAGVWTFFGIIHLWADLGPATFSARWQFFLRMIGF